MKLAVNVLPGLPPYGALATPFPLEWGKSGREGLVVEFAVDSESWVANFKPGGGGIQLAETLPDGRRAVVVSSGDLWVVDPVARSADLLLPAVDSALPVNAPAGWIFTRQSIAFARLGPQGLLWHTKRLSLDGFDWVRIEDDRLSGVAWTGVDDDWAPFEVELATGRSQGGGFSAEDIEGWERLAREDGGGAA
jgi:hypothetical protein